MEQVDTIIIGAGVVGLACAMEIAKAGREVLILEADNRIGSGISSRNSEVIHAGIYYPAGSLKARACVEGNRMLRAYAQSRGVPYKMTGKLIVATTPEEEQTLSFIEGKAIANGVLDLKKISGEEARKLEPSLNCVAALLSPSTGIIDSHSLMQSYLGEAEAHGTTLSLTSRVIAGDVKENGIHLVVDSDGEYRISARNLVIAAGLNAPLISKKLGLKNIPDGHLCKGNYFSLTGRSPFSRLIYPVPVAGGLGTHLTLDMGGQAKFGPDVEWVDEEDYRVNEQRRSDFAMAVRRFWPECKEEDLQPAYAGIRPKICAKGAPDEDFRIWGEEEHGGRNVISLLGIESPGLTSSLALAAMVKEMISR